MILNAQVQILNNLLKARIIKDVGETDKLKNIDKVGKPIKRRGKKKSKKKSKLLDLTNIKTSSNQVVPTIEKQQTIKSIDKFLLTKSPKPVPLYSKTKIWPYTSCANYKNINSIYKK